MGEKGRERERGTEKRADGIDWCLLFGRDRSPLSLSLSLGLSVSRGRSRVVATTTTQATGGRSRSTDSLDERGRDISSYRTWRSGDVSRDDDPPSTPAGPRAHARKRRVATLLFSSPFLSLLGDLSLAASFFSFRSPLPFSSLRRRRASSPTRIPPPGTRTFPPPSPARRKRPGFRHERQLDRVARSSSRTLFRFFFSSSYSFRRDNRALRGRQAKSSTRRFARGNRG